MSTATIRRVSHSEILRAVNAPEIIAEYAAECSLPGAQPQVKMYAAMEEAGVLQCIGAWVRRDHPFESETLVGFINVLNTLMPHNGQRVATVESSCGVSAKGPLPMRYRCALGIFFAVSLKAMIKSSTPLRG